MNIHPAALPSMTSIATYYVAPYQLLSSDGTGPQKCAYYMYTPPPSSQPLPGTWTPMGSKPLTAAPGADYVCLRQLMDPKERGLSPPAPSQWTSDVTMFAGIARTGGNNPAGPLANLFLANRTRLNQGQGLDAGPALIVPVDPKTTRSLILVFSRPPTSANPCCIVATYDPEIQGSTNG